MLDDEIILKEILNAIENEKLEMFYQPIVSVKTNETIGYEALVRWNRLGISYFDTEQLVLILEKNKKTLLLDRLVIKLVLGDIQKYFQKLNLKISINVSISAISNLSFYREFMKLVKEYRVDPNLINFEIIESDKITNFRQFKKRISKFTKHGIRLSLDDYGTGFNGFEVLRLIDFHELKIDKTFIHQINHSINFNLLQRLVDLGKSKQVDVVIEGVETKEQLDLIKETDCDYVQGYYFSKPKPVSELTELLNITK